MRLLKYSVLLLALSVCGCEAAKPPVQEGPAVKKTKTSTPKDMSMVPAEAP